MLSSTIVLTAIVADELKAPPRITRIVEATYVPGPILGVIKVSHQ
jgi:hypothetical protein